MTTPAPDSPLVFPSVAFRPARLLALCAILAAAALALAPGAGPPQGGGGLGPGPGRGRRNPRRVKRSVASITADAHPVKRKMAVNSATRLLIITTIGLAVAFVFRPPGLGVVFGLAAFQIVLVITTALPVWKKLRTGHPDDPSIGETSPAIPAPLADDMLKD